MENTKKTPGHFNLALVLGVIISILLITLGTAITLYTYNSQKVKALSTTEELMDFSSQRIEEKLQGLISPVESFVRISSALDELGFAKEENFNLLLSYFQQSFFNIPWMGAFYVGYDDGAFMMIQAVKNKKALLTSLAAPKQTEYVVKHIIPQKDGDKLVFLHFYNAELSLLHSEEHVFDGYDPRQRSWYTNTLAGKKTVITKPYVFFTTGELGITVAHRLKQGSGVVGADSALTSIAEILKRQKITKSSEIILSNNTGNILFAASDNVITQLQKKHERNIPEELHVSELKNQLANVLFKEFIQQGIQGGGIVSVNGQSWFGHVRKLEKATQENLFIITGAPINELMEDARATLKRNATIMLSAIFFAVGIGLYLSRRIATPLHDLSAQAESIRDFKLHTPFTVVSKISEVCELADTMTVMQSAINHFVEISRALSAEKKLEPVLEMIIGESQSITRADGGAIGLVSDDGKEFSYVLLRNDKVNIHIGGMSASDAQLPVFALDGSENNQYLLEKSVIHTGTTIAVTDPEDISYNLAKSLCQLHAQEGYTCSSLLMIPLRNRQNEVIGLLHLVNARDSLNNTIIPFPEHKISYVQALSSNAALALDNNRLFRAQKELFNSFIRLIAGAIDTKSPYTGGHCQRVPIIAGLLADAAALSEDAHFRDFRLSEDEKYELFIASWLHDCGKITTPEYVVDKATKLETIYNRIHEIRTRFEVLHRDVDIEFYKEIAVDAANRKDLENERDRRHAQLQDDFAFIAQCNMGGEFMSPDKIERLRQIGSQTWNRYFDKQIGLSGDEHARMDLTETMALPVTETLLADKPEHIFPRLDGGHPYGDNPLKFAMPIPEHMYNQGELYNLSIAKGTLTPEERYKINDHIVQTIKMLNKLTFPKELKKVPDWAGNHHEKLDGTGYPRCIKGEQLSIPERIMAIADIFEALTADDRPYNTPKTLSQCIRIMSCMRNDGHICPDLFALLLTSGIYKEYAEKYMKPAQIDEVDIASYL